MNAWRTVGFALHGLLKTRTHGFSQYPYADCKAEGRNSLKRPVRQEVAEDFLLSTEHSWRPHAQAAACSGRLEAKRSLRVKAELQLSGKVHQ